MSLQRPSQPQQKPKAQAPPVRLSSWGQRVKEHLRQHRPKEAQRLEKAGLLDQEAQRWADQARDALVDRVSQGGDPNLAQEVANRYLYLPDEQSYPNLDLYDPLMS